MIGAEWSVGRLYRLARKHILEQARGSRIGAMREWGKKGSFGASSRSYAAGEGVNRLCEHLVSEVLKRLNTI